MKSIYDSKEFHEWREHNPPTGKCSVCGQNTDPIVKPLVVKYAFSTKTGFEMIEMCNDCYRTHTKEQA